MVVVNTEPRLLVLGDGFRAKGAKKPGECTHLYPGKVVALEDIPKDRQERFKKSVHDAIDKGHKIKVYSSADEVPKDTPKGERAAIDEELEKLNKLANAVEEPKPKRGPGRPRKTPPLGG